MLLEELNLQWCRITQGEDSHSKPWNGKTGWGTYAFDIACIPWLHFDVYSPSYFDRYVVDYIGNNTALGTYVILKHWDFRFLYAHVTSYLKVWDRIWPHHSIGSTNRTGISSWVHLHIEMWKRYSNIRWSHIYWEEIIANPNSIKLREQRGWKLPPSPKKIIHKLWQPTDPRLEYVNYAYNLWGKQFVALLEWENWLWNIDRQSIKPYYRQEKVVHWIHRPAWWYYDYWFCQISDYYHPHITTDDRFYTDWKWQIDKCYELYIWGTRFYADRNIPANILMFKYIN